VTASANVDLVRRGFEAASSRPPDWETVNDTFDADHEFASFFDVIEGGTWTGATGWRDFMAEMDRLGEWRWDIEEVRNAAGGRVLVRSRFSLRGRRSGVPVDSRTGMLVSVDAGKIRRTQVLPSWQQALDAAGVAE
jgi:ketosteroid isomerase-like protein